MIQFTEQEAGCLRKKAKNQSWILEMLYDQVREVYESELLVPEIGIGNWGLYYFCEDCSVPLVFDRRQPKKHVCPNCKRVFTGEPYDSTWWGKVNYGNQNAAEGLGRLYLLTKEHSYGRKAADLLLKYAAYYPDYQVHGDIPYNGPGKANAQTLDEAIFLRTLAFAYDLVRDCMTEEEQRLAETRLFLPGVEFLREHRHPQLHNHEVIIDSAMGVLGILLSREEYTEEGLHSKYGLIYQLEHGMQEDHMWFEGTFGYHYYALENFLAFEKFAVHTPYSNLGHPNYQKMLELILSYIQDDNHFPRINDIYGGHGGLEGKYLYEFAYRHLPTDKMKQIMGLIYREQDRKNVEAFFYGAKEVETRDFVPSNYHSDTGSGYTVLRGKGGRYLIFKHGNYGGEHDHYDRLGISYRAHGADMMADLGTTGYGAALHYDYYKNTGTHNTVCIGESNQPPVRARTLKYEEREGVVYVEAEADWRKPYEMPDSFTIVQWEEENYKNVVMTRKIAWADDFFVDLFLVEGAGDQTVDWIVHVAGERVPDGGTEQELPRFTDKKPLKYLHDVRRRTEHKTVKTVYSTGESGAAALCVYSLFEEGEMYLAKGPDNPSIRDMEYLVWRVRGGNPMFLNVFQSMEAGDSTDRIREVSFRVKDNRVHILVEMETKSQEIIF